MTAGRDGVSGRPGDRAGDRADGRSRREVVGGLAGFASLCVAGCVSLDGGGDSGSGANESEPTFSVDSPPSLPTVEDPPGVVYVPSHREGVESLGPVTAGPYRVRALVSYAHPFWTVTGDAVESVEVDDGDVDVHLMVAVEDRETGTVLPVGSGLSITIRKDGAVVVDRTPWRMLSQTMGYHFGDNVPLDDDGEYTIHVSLPPLGVRRTGALAGRFESAATAQFSFTYDQQLRDALIDRIRYTDDADRGVPGAIEPMDAAGSLPDAEALPGTLQGVPASDDWQLPRSHDADVAITVIDGFLGDGDPYLLVSPRTPYNRFPIVGTAIEATVRPDRSEPETGTLDVVVDDQVGYHYGARMPAISAGDDLRLSFTTVPSVARHQGYETAFIEMEPIDISVEAW